jgi:hypothetical protein|tara:strand:- start:175 stop:387 length:213 start_codon:yes stop_codon:yes gene_type:complete
LDRKFAVVVQVSEDGFPQDRLVPLVEAIFKTISPYSFTISPEADEFIPFSTALEKLRGLMAGTPAEPPQQ